MNSVLYGRDNQAIPLLLDLHCDIQNPKILDVTHNQGVMWKGIAERYNLTTMDINPEFHTNLLGDFTAIPCEDSSFDVIVFDPPHLPAAAVGKNGNIYGDKYGITLDVTLRADNIDGYFLPFLLEARRVLRPNGIILAKIADITHNHRYQWQHVLFINAVNATGMTPCDCLIKTDPSAGHLVSGQWEKQHHLRKAHCYWIVVRNSSKCEGMGRIRKNPEKEDSMQFSLWVSE